MARIFLIATLIASLAISYVIAADVPIKVGGPTGQLLFDPAIATVQPGDTVTFMWVSGKHSVVQSDAAKSCVKSATLNDISQAATDVVGTKYVYTVPKTATGKMWYFCGVPGHCQAGMYGTLVVGGSNSTAPTSGAGSPTSSGAGSPTASGTDSSSPTASGSGSAASPTGSTKSSAKRIDSNIAIAGAMAAVGLIGLLI